MTTTPVGSVSLAEVCREPIDSQDDVGQCRERRGDPAVGRVGDQRDGHDGCPVKLAQRLTRLDHLHQRQRALLHARATGSGDEQQRGAFPQSRLSRHRDELTRDLGTRAEPPIRQLGHPAPRAQRAVHLTGHDQADPLADLPACLGDRVQTTPPGR